MARNQADTEEFKVLRKLARRPAGRLVGYSVLASLAPLPLLAFADGSMDTESLLACLMLLGLLLQLVVHFIYAKCCLFKWLFRPDYEPHLNQLGDKKTFGPYFWGWYARYWGFLILLMAIFYAVNTLIPGLAGKNIGGGGLIIYYIINQYTIISLIQRLIRGGQAAL